MAARPRRTKLSAAKAKDGSSENTPSIEVSATRPPQVLASGERPSTADPPADATSLASEHSPPNFHETIPAPRPRTKAKFQPKAAPRRTQDERDALDKEEMARQASHQRSGFTPLGRDGRSRRTGNLGPENTSHWRQAPANRQWQASGVLGGSEIKEKQSRGRRGKAGAEDSVATRDRDTAIESVEDEQSAKSPQRKRKVKKEGEGVAHAGKDADGDEIMSAGATKRRSTKANAKIKQEPEAASTRAGTSHWDDETGKRVDISHISLISSEEEDDQDDDASTSSKGKTKGAISRLLPVRLERHDHVDKQLGFNTDSSSLTSAELRRLNLGKAKADGSLSLKEDQVRQTINSVHKAEKSARGQTAKERRAWRGAWQDEGNDEAFEINEVSPPRKGAHERDDMLVEDENLGTEDEIMGDGFLDSTTETKASHVGRREEDGGNGQGPGQRHPTRSHLQKKTKPKYLTTLPMEAPIPDLHNDEDMAEMIRIAKEYQQEDPDLAADDPAIYGEPSDLKGNPGRETRVYLLQLPPILPTLRDRNKAISSIKREKSKTPVNVAQPGTSKSQSGATLETKLDLDARAETKGATTGQDANTSSTTYPSGCPGTLTFYKSGEIKANWGGLNLDVVQSHQTGFGQEILVHEYQAVNTKVENQDRWEEVVDVGKEAWSMGQVEGGFVAVPDWEVLLDG